MRQIKPGDAVFVVWEDSCGSGTETWEDLKDMRITDVLCKSLGWVVKKTRNHVLIVPHVAPAVHAHKDQGCADMTIPLSAVRSINKLNGVPASGLSV
jgi:hypothetical protein